MFFGLINTHGEKKNGKMDDAVTMSGISNLFQWHFKVSACRTETGWQILSFKDALGNPSKNKTQQNKTPEGLKCPGDVAKVIGF